MASFTPINKFSSTSLVGVAEPIRFMGLSDRPERAELGERNIHPIKEEDSKRYSHTIIIIVISAIIFVTVVAIYDVLRNYINNYYASRALRDPLSTNTVQDISRTETANRSNFVSSLIFALVCVLVALVLIPLLIHLDRK